MKSEKSLSDLTKEEWDTLFPVKLVDHDPDWKNVFLEEKQKISERLDERIISVEHVGSTSIPGIRSKPYIDISIEIDEQSLFDEHIITVLTDLGYHYFMQSGKGVDYMVFVKGYNLQGKEEQVYHIHMCPSGHEMLNQVHFRDFLLENEERAGAYERLKIELATTYKNDRVGYRIAKDDFIEETMSMRKNQPK